MYDLRNIDEQISDLSERIDFYGCLTPVNQEDQREKFFESLAKGIVYDPVFEYSRPLFDAEKEDLNNLLKDLNGDKGCLETLFLRKIEYLLSQIRLLSGDDKNLIFMSGFLFGVPKEEILRTSYDILIQSAKQEYDFPEETVTPGEMIKALKQDLTKKNINEWNVLLTDEIIPKITVSGRDKAIYVNSRMNFTPEEIQRLIVHELEVHVYRGLNGASQPFRIFAEGLAGYDETEEGLAVIAEEKAGCLEIDKRQIKLYAGRYLAVECASRGSFFETYMKLMDFFPGELAYRLTERVKRGLRNTGQKGAFTKDLQYLSGLNENRIYLSEKGDIKILYTGKIGLQDVECVRTLLEKNILKAPEYIPEYFK